MTPDKVRELVQWHMMSYPLCTTENVTRVVLSVLAEARKDARHAALTEAAETCMLEYTRTSAIANSPLSTDVGTLVHDGMSMGAENCRVGIIALRDKEQP